VGALPTAAQCTVLIVIAAVLTAIVIAVLAEIRELEALIAQITASIATASEVAPQPRLPTPPPHLRSPCQITAVLHRVAKGLPALENFCKNPKRSQ